MIAIRRLLPLFAAWVGLLVLFQAWVPRGVFHQGLRYLQATADSTFKPVRLRQNKDED